MARYSIKSVSLSPPHFKWATTRIRLRASLHCVFSTLMCFLNERCESHHSPRNFVDSSTGKDVFPILTTGGGGGLWPWCTVVQWNVWPCTLALVGCKPEAIPCRWGISCELALRWMSLALTDDKSTLVQVMAWCHQATSHYLSQCWPRSLSTYGVTRPQWVKIWCKYAEERNAINLITTKVSPKSITLNMCEYCGYRLYRSWVDNVWKTKLLTLKYTGSSILTFSHKSITNWKQILQQRQGNSTYWCFYKQLREKRCKDIVSLEPLVAD